MPATLITSRAYTQRVTKAIQHAKNRVYVLALIIQQTEDASEIITALTRAANRGVDVNVVADFSTAAYANGHLNPYYGYINQVRSARDLANRLRSSGASFTWVGTRSPFLFAGRTHSKWIVADDVVFCFGGINLHTNFEGDSDYMFEQRDQALADALVNEHKSILHVENLDTAYRSIEVDTSQGRLLIDGGIPFDSIICRKAVKVINSAQKVLMVTQYCPTGRIAHALKHTTYQAYYNEPTTKDLLTNVLISTGKLITDIPNMYKRKTYIHAKFLIATDAEGKKTAITGSHNFLSYGVMLGTREIALMTTDPAVIKSLEVFYETYIA